MADASAMPMDNDVHQKMVATPVEPMTPAQCEHCASRDEKKEPTPCNGHCFSQGESANPANLVFGYAPLIAAVPVLTPFLSDVTGNAAPLPTINKSPPHFFTNSVVLRL